MRRFVGVVLAFGTVLVLAGCSGRTIGATNVTDFSATLHATGRCDSGQRCTWYWEYWRANQPRSSSVKTQVFGPVNGPTGNVNLSNDIAGLNAGTAYRWVFCASPNSGGVYACAGPNGTFGSTTADPPPDYEAFTTPTRATLAERWDGTAWTLQDIPNPTGAGDSTLSGVSCTSATACTAVGEYSPRGSDNVALAERWDGTTWTVQPTPSPAGSGLSGVSCTSATACTAVGTAPPRGTFAERWDGTAWTIQATPSPTGGGFSSLRGVSCTSPMACTAVGYTSNAGVYLPLAERWDGTTWTIQTTPHLAGGSVTMDYLYGVSCTSATACTAVGNYFNGNVVTLAERWDGTTWTIQTTPNASGFNNLLFGVSCTSATACTATGYHNPSSPPGQLPLAEGWDGTTWTIQTTADSNGFLSLQGGVSCTSATACTAVGYSATPIAQMTLAERGDGTFWAIQTTPNPTGAPASVLQGVSCASATACTAVGYQ